MTREEYNILFHKEQLNLVAFKRLMDCDEEVLRLINRAVQEEREACAKVAEEYANGLERNYSEIIADEIRARGKE
jgi:hypothetical protein